VYGGVIVLLARLSVWSCLLLCACGAQVSDWVTDPRLPWALVPRCVPRDPDTGLPHLVRDSATGIDLVLILRGNRPGEMMPFYLGRYEVTWAQWLRVFGSWEYGVASDHGLPATFVSWSAAQDFCTHAGLRLPTEDEWEFSCRAGQMDPGGLLDRIGWYGANSGMRLHMPGLKKPNRWGLHDMIGNAWEWTATITTAEPRMAIQRGGCCKSPADMCTAAFRSECDVYVREGTYGFRVARDP